MTPDGRRAVSGSDDNTLKVWDLERGAELATLEGHGGGVNAVAVTPDGRRAVSGSRQHAQGLGPGAGCRACHARRPRRLGQGGGRDPGRAARGLGLVRQDAQGLGPGAGCRACHARRPRRQVRAVAVTPDGRRAVSGSGQDAQGLGPGAGEELATLEGHSGAVKAVAVTPDGRRAVSGLTTERSRSGTWYRGVQCPSRPTRPSTPSLASPDRLLVAGDAGGRVHLLELVLPADRLTYKNIILVESVNDPCNQHVMLASASYATRKGLQRPFARATAQHRHLGHKLSMGLSTGRSPA